LNQNHSLLEFENTRENIYKDIDFHIQFARFVLATLYTYYVQYWHQMTDRKGRYSEIVSVADEAWALVAIKNNEVTYEEVKKQAKELQGLSEKIIYND